MSSNLSSYITGTNLFVDGGGHLFNKNEQFHFLNKETKTALRYKVLTDLNQISDNALSIVKKYKIYNLLTKEFDQNL